MSHQEVLVYFSENKDGIAMLAALGALAMTALTALFSLIGAIGSKKIDEKIKRQESIRLLLEDGMIGIGENMHQVLASADILVQKFQLKANKNDQSLELSIKKYKSRIATSKKHLTNAKTIYRYKLYGLDEGLAIIARSGDWIKGLRNDIERANKILREADKVRKIIDKTIIKCYRKGDYPSIWVRYRLKYHTWRIKKIRNSKI